MESWISSVIPQLGTDLEGSFANGYYLGQLLYSVGLVKNFESMVNSERYADQNLKIAAATLRPLKICLDQERVKAKSVGYIQSVLVALYANVQAIAAQDELPRKKHPSEAERRGVQGPSRFEQERLRQISHAIEAHKQQELAIKRVNTT